MLISVATLKAIQERRIRLVFRRWKTQRVLVGTQLRTAVGLLEVANIEPITLAALSAGDAQAAGYASRAQLVAELSGRGQGRLYRIELQHLGADPRIALRESSELSSTQLAELGARVEALGARSDVGPWARSVLKLIANQPAVRAPDLAAQLGLETKPFKTRVRQLKELGLTESLKVGYRLSPRGEKLCRQLFRSESKSPTSATEIKEKHD